MSIDNIRSKIINSAENAADSSLANAEKTKSEIINNAKGEAEAIINIEAERAQKDAEDLQSRKVSAAQLQKRKMLLSAKQEAIKKSFARAIDELKAMPQEQYLNFLVREIVKIPDCQGTIFLNAKDRKNIGEKLVKAVNEKLKEEKVVLSDDTVLASGGFVLKKGNVSINSTFETIIDSFKDELTGEIANALFE